MVGRDPRAAGGGAAPRPCSVTHVLVTGAGGQLGTALRHCAMPDGWEARAIGAAELDLADTAAIPALIRDGYDGRPWAAVINAAAYTAVDRAERDIVAAWRVNALAPAALSESCAAAGIPIVQLSTDYVFSGDKTGAWQVDDPVAPCNVYGASKLGGELAVRSSGVRHAIVRTAWLFGPDGGNFVRTMLTLAASRDRLRIIDDQVGSPTSAVDLADVLVTIARRLCEDHAAPVGTFHFTNAGSVSWAGFAAEIFRQSEARGGPGATVIPVATAEYPTAARRPANSRLSHDAIAAGYGIAPRDWQSALGDTLDTMIGTVR